MAQARKSIPKPKSNKSNKKALVRMQANNNVLNKLK